MIDQPKPQQGLDGQAHFAYFDQRTRLAFTWDGQNEFVEVSHDGYAEPVVDHLRAHQMGVANTAAGWLRMFSTMCDAYIAIKYPEGDKHGGSNRDASPTDDESDQG